MWNSSAQTPQPMTQSPDKLPLLPAVGAGVEITRHGPQTSDKHQKGLVPQSEVDKQTHIVNRHYDDAEFDQLTPAEKQKLCQLMNTGKTPGTGPTRRDRRRAAALTSTSSTSSGGPSKRQMEDPAIKSNQPAADQGWGRNRDNPCLGRQVRPRGDDN
jgi:hypothetical protein